MLMFVMYNVISRCLIYNPIMLSLLGEIFFFSLLQNTGDFNFQLDCESFDFDSFFYEVPYCSDVERGSSILHKFKIGPL